MHITLSLSDLYINRNNLIEYIRSKYNENVSPPLKFIFYNNNTKENFIRHSKYKTLNNYFKNRFFKNINKKNKLYLDIKKYGWENFYVKIYFKTNKKKYTLKNNFFNQFNNDNMLENFISTIFHSESEFPLIFYSKNKKYKMQIDLAVE